jgi:hypothetical protein
MDTNMEIGEGTRFEVLLAVLLRFKVANMYWLFLFWAVGFLKMNAQCFLEAWGQLTIDTSSYPSKPNFCSKGHFCGYRHFIFLSMWVTGLPGLLFCCEVRTAFSYRLIDACNTELYFFINYKVSINLKRELENWPLSLSLSLSLSIYIYIYIYNLIPICSASPSVTV